MIAQDLWQAYHQILSLIFQKKFTKLNIKTDMKIKIVKLAELDKSIAPVFLNIQTLIEHKCLCCNIINTIIIVNYKHKFDQNLKEQIFNHIQIF